MAVAPFNTTALTASLEEITDKRIRPQLKRGHFMWSRFGQKTAKKVNTRKLRIPIRLHPSGVGTFLGENDELPEAQAELEADMTVGYTSYYKGFSFTAQAQMESSQASAIASIASRLDDYRVDMTVELSRFFYGSGNGAMAVITGAGQTGATYNLSTTTAAGSTLGSVYLEKGSSYNIVSSSLATIRATAGGVTDLIVSSKTASTVTFNASPASVGDGDLIVPAGTVSGGVSRAFHGLPYHIVRAAQSEYQGLSAATYPELESIVQDLSGAPLTLGAAEIIEEAAYFRRDGSNDGGGEGTANEDNSLIVTNRGQRARLMLALNTLRQYGENAKTLRTGATAVENRWGNRWEVDEQCPEDTIFHLDESKLFMVKNSDLEFVTDGSGNKMFLSVVTSATRGGRRHRHDGWFFLMFELGGYEPRCQAAIVGAEVTGTIRAKDWVR